MGLVTDAVGALLCLITLLAELVAKGAVEVFNIIIVALGGLFAAVIAALPDMPAWPDSPSGGWAWANWALPVSGLVALVTTAITYLVAWYGARLVLNWVKAL